MKLFTLSFLALLTFMISAQAQTVYDVTSYGAVGDGTALNTLAIQEAIDSCTANGGGVVLIPAGTFLTGTIILKNYVTLEIASGGELRGIANLNEYPEIPNNLASSANGYTNRALIFAQNAHHIGLKGAGKLNGQGSSFGVSNEGPYGIRFLTCQNIIIENLELRTSGYWMMHNFNCDSLIMRNLTVYNHGHANNDGLSIDACRNVLIENCTVDANNDPLVMKATGPYNCENVTARNCTLATWSRAIKIGTETNGGFKNIHIHDCNVVYSSLYVPNIIGLADCGINLSIVDGGWVDNVLIEDCTLEGINIGFMIRLGNRARQYDDTIPITNVGTMQGITIRNVEITPEANLPMLISGIPNHYVTDVLLKDIIVHYKGGEQAVPLDFPVPEAEAEKPDCDIFGETFPSCGIYARHTDNLVLDNVCFTFDNADQRPLVFFTDVINSEPYIGVDGQLGEKCVAIDTKVAEIDGQSTKVWFDQINGNLVFSDNLNLNTNLQVYDRAGRMVYNKLLSSGQVDLTDLDNGFYTWQLTNLQQTLGSGKFIRIQ